MNFSGFDWDNGNWPKCAKHGLTKEAIEWALMGTITIFDDPHNPDFEKRFRAVGRDDEGHYVFIVFCVREKAGKRLCRPISARRMHQQEVENYEQER